MKSSRKKIYKRPSMELITYEQASARIDAEQRPSTVADRLSLIALYASLLSLPLLVVLSAVDPTGFLVRQVLAPPSPLLWNVWAFACFWAGLSSNELLNKLGRKSPLRGHSPSLFFLLGLMNCISVVALLWLVGKAG